MSDKEAVIECLQEHHQPPLVALDLPDEDDIIDVEEAIYVQIRGDFRDFLLEVSDLVIGSLEPVTVTDPSSHTYLPEVASLAWESGMPRELLPICQTQAGYYCLDMEDNVVHWHDGKQGDGEWGSIWNWAEQVWLRS